MLVVCFWIFVFEEYRKVKWVSKSVTKKWNKITLGGLFCLFCFVLFCFVFFFFWVKHYEDFSKTSLFVCLWIYFLVLVWLMIWMVILCMTLLIGGKNDTLMVVWRLSVVCLVVLRVAFVWCGVFVHSWGGLNVIEMVSGFWPWDEKFETMGSLIMVLVLDTHLFEIRAPKCLKIQRNQIFLLGCENF